MRLTLMLITMACIGPLSACADDLNEPSTTTPNQSTPEVAANVDDHPPLFVKGVHDRGFRSQPKMTFGQYVEFALREGSRTGLDKKLTVEEFYAKNPEWIRLKEQRMPEGNYTFGVHH